MNHEIPCRHCGKDTRLMLDDWHEDRCAKRKWVGVDLDGTLARNDTPRAKPSDIGPPVAAMLERVKRWLVEGVDVRIVTARVNEVGAAEFGMTPAQQTEQIKDWLREHLGQALPVQCHKDYLMQELWDDRAVRVKRNEGTPE